MSNVLHVDIDPNIKLDEKRTKGMPDEIKGQLLATMTIAMGKYNCNWFELTWTVKPNGLINVKRKHWLE